MTGKSGVSARRAVYDCMAQIDKVYANNTYMQRWEAARMQAFASGIEFSSQVSDLSLLSPQIDLRF